ncbi:Ubiquitin-conjugating enzyme E2 6 [Thecaphora frezii]
MASKAAIRRLTKEAQLMEKDPPPFVFARPKEDNILEWHYILRGPPDTPYAGGEYHGQLLFPPEFPFKPPGIKMTTPSGRFKPDTKICTSMSDYHPHTWQPGWNTSTILIGLLSFMCSEEMTTGSVTGSDADRRTLAARSHEYNLSQKKFCQLFPEYATKEIRDLPNMGDKKPEPASSSTGGSSGDGKAQGLRQRAPSTEPAPDGSGTTSASASIPTAPHPAAAGGAPRAGAEAPRRDLFGFRSSMIVLALLAYLFFSRVMSSGDAAAGGSGM